jgi:hypothetical protein
MDNEYTPALGKIREAYVSGRSGGQISREDADAEFDRALEKVAEKPSDEQMNLVFWEGVYALADLVGADPEWLERIASSYGEKPKW